MILDNWNCAALPDGRRGLWWKVISDSHVALRSGREGDDALVDLMNMSPMARVHLLEVLETLRWASELRGDFDRLPDGYAFGETTGIDPTEYTWATWRDRLKRWWAK